MTLPRYNLPQISVAEQISLLKSEGLVFTDENREVSMLSKVIAHARVQAAVQVRVQVRLRRL